MESTRKCLFSLKTLTILLILMFIETESKEGCKELLDVIVVCDGSDSISDDDYIKLKTALQRLATSLDIKENGVHMGIVVYSTDVPVKFALNSNLQQVKDQITAMPHPKDGTNTHLGIIEMRNLFNGHHRKAPTIGIVITDGDSKSPSETKKEAKLCHNLNISMYAVGVGRIKQAELNAIASNKNQVLKVQTFEQLLSELGSLIQMVCPTTTTSTTTTTTTTTPPPSTTTPKPPPPPPNNVKPLLRGGPCDNCTMENGVGYNNHPEDCDKFTQCEFGPANDFRVHFRDCPIGQYWHNDALTCRPAEQVECHFEKCRLPGLISYPMSNQKNCRAYWKCNLGKSIGMCCPEQMRYVPYKSCVKDSSCNDTCPPQTYHTGPCDKIAHWTDPGKFYQMVPLVGLQIMPCAPGTHYNPTDCQCSFHTAYLPTAPICRPEVYIPFDTDAKDQSGNHVYILNKGVRLAGNSLGYFNGRSSLIIPRFANFEFQDLVIKIVFHEERRTSHRFGCLLSNSCCHGKPSLAILKSPRNVHFMTRVEGGRITAMHVPKVSGKWNKVYYIHDRKKMEISCNGIPLSNWCYGKMAKVVNSHGKLDKTHGAITIGAGKGFPSFRGFIDEITIYTCRPSFL